MKEYRWRITESAPKEYVITIISGHFETADGYQKGVPTGADVDTGWSKGRSNIVSGRETMPVPTRFELTWFSYREDTFYHANFDLPAERIQTLFELDRRAPYTLNEHPGNTFKLGLAPQGFMVIWLLAGNHCWEVFRGKAEAVEGIPWKVIFDKPEVSKEEIMQLVINDSLAKVPNSPHLNDPSYWQRLHEEVYEYDIVVDSEYTPYVIKTGYLNGERHKYYVDAQNWRAAPLSVPTRIAMNYIFPDETFLVELENINTDKMYEAFRALSSESSSPLRVMVKIDGLLPGEKLTSHLRVENDLRTIEITEYEFGRYEGGERKLETVKKSKDLMRYMNYPGKPATP